HVGHGRVRLHDVAEGRAGRRQRRLYVLAHLADLGAHVALAHDVAAAITRELTSHEDHAFAFDRDDVRVEGVAAADRRGERLGLDILAGHRHDAVLSPNGRPVASDRRTPSSRLRYASSGAAPTPSRTLLKKQRAAAASTMSRISGSENPWRRSAAMSSRVTVLARAVTCSANAIIATSAGGSPAL